MTYFSINVVKFQRLTLLFSIFSTKPNFSGAKKSTQDLHQQAEEDRGPREFAQTVGLDQQHDEETATWVSRREDGEAAEFPV